MQLAFRDCLTHGDIELIDMGLLRFREKGGGKSVLGNSRSGMRWVRLYWGHIGIMDNRMETGLMFFLNSLGG